MNLIPEKVGKFSGEKETSLYHISKPFALINTKCNQHECTIPHVATPMMNFNLKKYYFSYIS